MGSDRVDLELLRRVQQVDFDRNTQDGVCAALLLSVSAELDSVKMQGSDTIANESNDLRCGATHFLCANRSF